MSKPAPSKPTVAVVGASDNRAKYGNKSVRAHLDQGYQVFPVNPKGGQIEGLTAYASLTEVPVEQLDRVTFYVPPGAGLSLLEQVAAKQPKEFFLNPGTESAELVAAAEALGLQPIQACSIVELGTSPGQYGE